MSNEIENHVLLIEDDADAATMLAEYLKTEGFGSEIAATGPDGLALALSGRFDAVILDIMLPRMPGTEVLRQLRRESQVPVLMLTAKGDDFDRVLGLEWGADDYITKPYFPRELTARLRAVLRRHRGGTVPKEVHTRFRNGPLLVDTASRHAWIDEIQLDLTVSEFNLLAILIQHIGKAVSKDDLSVLALNRRRSSFDRGIDVHISNLRQKLQIQGGTPVGLQTVRGVGYRLEPLT